MDDVDLDDLEAKARAATQGEWALSKYAPNFVSVDDCELCKTFTDHPNRDGPSDAAYIAAANPSAVLALIARIKELEGIIDDMNVNKFPPQNHAPF